MHNFFGNSQMHSGYACLMQTLVAEWRSLWSATPGTTDPLAPFGLVTLAPSGTEGGASIGDMRWAQTASYGVTPNSALPNVFVAQAYDLGDPFSNDTCYGKVHCHDNSIPPAGGWPDGCAGYCDSVKTTNWYMVGSHDHSLCALPHILPQRCTYTTPTLTTRAHAYTNSISFAAKWAI
jgi:hypothetical protein